MKGTLKSYSKETQSDIWGAIERYRTPQGKREDWDIDDVYERNEVDFYGKIQETRARGFRRKPYSVFYGATKKRLQNQQLLSE